MWKGQVYIAKCGDGTQEGRTYYLNLPREQWTKEGSRAAANAWWERLHAQLVNNPVKDAFERLVNDVPLEELTRRLKRSIVEGDRAKLLIAHLPEALEYSPELVDEILGFPCQEDGERAKEMLATLSGSLELAPEIVDKVKKFYSDKTADEKRLEFLSQMNSSGTPPERTITALAKRWVTARQEEVRAGRRSADGADNMRIALSHFEAFSGGISADGIDFDHWERWYIHCAGRMNEETWSSDYAKKCFGTARAFVRWLWESKVLDSLPRNLNSKMHRFDTEQKTPPTFLDAEVRSIVSAASGQHRLLILLMLNCGMTQKDIADLRKDQLDLTAGTITRRRSKTKTRKSTPKVCYKLWPETLELLRKHLTPEGELALRTKSGEPWVWKKLEREKLKKSDNVATVFNNLKKKIKMTGADKSLKVFRKTAATKLKSNTTYRDLRFFFLGHSARTIADKHYAGEDQKLLSEATDWLRQQFLGV